jgi:hypothetical protein
MQTSKFKIGDKVAVIDSRGIVAKLSEVEAISPKRGDIKVVKSDWNFGPDGYAKGDAYNRPHIEHLTDEHIKKYNINKMVWRISKIDFNKVSYEKLVEVYNLLKVEYEIQNKEI